MLRLFQPVVLNIVCKIVLFTIYDLDNVKQRMKLLYDRNDEHSLDVGTLRMLVYVPVADIPVTK